VDVDELRHGEKRKVSRFEEEEEEELGRQQSAATLDLWKQDEEGSQEGGTSTWYQYGREKLRGEGERGREGVCV
jgi:hypothetical protein